MESLIGIILPRGKKLYYIRLLSSNLV